MTEQSDIEKRFLERVSAEREANNTKVTRQAEIAEASFKAILTTVDALSNAVRKINSAEFSIRTPGIQRDDDGNYFVSVFFKKHNDNQSVVIKLIHGTSRGSEFLVLGLSSEAASAISGARQNLGSMDIHADANQGFEIAKALEDFAVKHYGAA